MKRQTRAHWRRMSRTGWLLALAMWARPASAQTPRDSASAQVTAEREELSQASPRVAVEAYLRLARAGRFPEAARYLDLGDSLATQGAVLARRLKAVLDRHAWIDLDEVSGLAIGDTADGLPATVDQIAVIPVEGTRSEPVRMARTVVERDPQWRFTRSTVLRIDGWYESLPDQWVLEHLPQPLLRPGPLELLWWQWLTIPLLVGVAAVVGYLASRGLLALVVRAVRRTRSG